MTKSLEPFDYDENLVDIGEIDFREYKSGAIDSLPKSLYIIHP